MDIQQLQAALDCYYYDCTRSASETIERLEEIAEDIEMKIEGLRATSTTTEPE